MSVWLTSLACCPAPGRAVPDPLRAHRLPAGRERSNVVAVAADHDRERAVARADVAAGDRRVDGRDAALGRRLGDLLGQRRLAGGHVDQHAAGPQPASAPSLAERHLAHVGRDSRRSKTRRRPSAAASRGLSAHAAPRATSGSALARVRLCTVDAVAGVHQPPAHARAHHAQADPGEARAVGREEAQSGMAGLNREFTMSEICALRDDRRRVLDAAIAANHKCRNPFRIMKSAPLPPPCSDERHQLGDAAARRAS